MLQGSIRQRLTVIIMSVSIAAVLLTLTAITFFNIAHLRRNMVEELTLTATVVADSNAGVVAAEAENTARNNLTRVFDNRTDVFAACLYKDGLPFASYFHFGAPLHQCPLMETQSYRFTDNYLQLFQPVMKDGKEVGMLFLASDVRGLNNFLHRQASVVLLVLLTVAAMSYIMARALQRSITRPVAALVDTARAVIDEKDYSVRAPVSAFSDDICDELTRLLHSFNAMLDEIELRDRDLRLKNEALIDARAAAEAASKAKSEFLANISHELRTPLNAIIGFSDIIKGQIHGPTGSDKYLEYAKDINDSGIHLLRIINDILDISKAEAGMLSFDEKEINVGRTLVACMRLVSEQAKRNQIALHSEIPRDIPAVWGDYIRFKQVVLNLLSNAVKFTPSGGTVILKCEVEDNHRKQPQLLISISDNGIGIAQEDIEVAMQFFGQIDSGLNRKFDGTGLGLPLAKKLAEMHGGEFSLTSEIGKGTVVSFTIPHDRILWGVEGE